MEGIIYKTQTINEYDKLLFVYTKRGFVSILAKGAHKYKSTYFSLAQNYNVIEFEDSTHKDMFTLRKTKLLNNNYELKSNYNNVEILSSIFNFITSVTILDDNHSTIYDLVMKIINNFNDHTLLFFYIKALKVLGFHLDFNKEKPYPVGFNIAKSKLVYSKSLDIADINIKTTHELMKLLNYKTVDNIQIDQNEFEYLKQFVILYYKYHVQTTIKF